MADNTDNTAPQPDETATGRLFRAQSTELQALRRQLATMPDPDTWEEIRSKAERFDQLEKALPDWQEKVRSAFQATQQQSAAAIEAERQQAQETKLRSDVMTAFLRNGGIPQWSEAFYELIGRRAHYNDQGQLVTTLTSDGKPIPFDEAMQRLEADPNYRHFMHLFLPKYGSGGNAPPNKDRRTFVDTLEGKSSVDLIAAGLKS